MGTRGYYDGRREKPKARMVRIMVEQDEVRNEQVVNMVGKYKVDPTTHPPPPLTSNMALHPQTLSPLHGSSQS